MSKKQQYFTDPSDLTKWIKWVLYAQVVIAIIAIISSTISNQLLLDLKNGVYSSQELACAACEDDMYRQGIVKLLGIIIFFVSGILILKWIYRANCNARQLGVSGMKFTPAWSIAWYFIPIANLWKPYQAMKEIWKTSSNPHSWNSQAVSPLLPWWWFFWIVSNMFWAASFRLEIRSNKIIYEHIAANLVSQLSNLTDILLSLLVIGIIRKIHEMQMSHAKAVGKI